jgi:periplasmic divalent cation tolerance protein
MKALVVFSTVPNEEAGEAIAKVLVEESLVACVNLVPGLRSLYRWKGEVQDDQEVLLVIKTTEQNYPQLEKRIRELHSYDVPEIIALGIKKGHGPYLAWLQEMCAEEEGRL